MKGNREYIRPMPGKPLLTIQTASGLCGLFMRANQGSDLVSALASCVRVRVRESWEPSWSQKVIKAQLHLCPPAIPVFLATSMEDTANIYLLANRRALTVHTAWKVNLKPKRHHIHKPIGSIVLVVRKRKQPRDYLHRHEG